MASRPRQSPYANVIATMYKTPSRLHELTGRKPSNIVYMTSLEVSLLRSASYMVPLPHHTKHADVYLLEERHRRPSQRIAMVAQVRKTYPDHTARYPRPHSKARTKDHTAIVVVLSDLPSISQAYFDSSIYQSHHPATQANNFQMFNRNN